MKIKIILTGLMAVSFLACNSENKAGLTSTAKTERTVEHSNEEEDHAGGLSLNQGSKWQTDESTRFHAANLNTLVDEFHKKENADVESYHVFAATMQEELGGLVKDCKMKGADHEALHLWLEPVMKGVNDLKEAGTAEEGKHVGERLTINVQKFNQYFENAH